MSLPSQIGEINSGAPRVIARPAAALGVIGTHNIFTITDTVLIKLLVGEVIATIAAVATTIQLQVANTDRATTVALDSAALNVNAEPAGTLWQLADVSSANPIAAVDATATLANYALGVLTGTIGVVCTTGSIQLVVAGANNTTGSVAWYCMWVPLAPTARVLAA